MRTKSGHCQYFATATVLLLREVGVSARLITGYAVPESARQGDTYLIRERHAHAWALVFHSDSKTWEQIDNTPSGWAEAQAAPWWESASDFFSNLYFQFSKWRWGKTSFARYAERLLVPLILYLLVRIVTSQHRKGALRPARGRRGHGLAGFGLGTLCDQPAFVRSPPFASATRTAGQLAAAAGGGISDLGESGPHIPPASSSAFRSPRLGKPRPADAQARSGGVALGTHSPCKPSGAVCLSAGGRRLILTTENSMKAKVHFLFLILASLSGIHQAAAQSTAFTYQGQLSAAGGPANGSYDLAFSLFGAASGGTPSAGPITNSATQVSNGLFTVTLDFGAGVFTGSNYWLDISVSPAGSNTFTELSPRQPLTPVPYALLFAERRDLHSPQAPQRRRRPPPAPALSQVRLGAM